MEGAASCRRRWGHCESVKSSRRASTLKIRSGSRRRAGNGGGRGGRARSGKPGRGVVGGEKRGTCADTTEVV